MEAFEVIFQKKWSTYLIESTFAGALFEPAFFYARAGVESVIGRNSGAPFLLYPAAQSAVLM